MTPDLSILFAFRNREQIRVKRCLDSLSKQTHTNFEVIFVDTGSELELAAEIKKLVESYDFATYIYTDTRGLYWNKGEAINIAADRATADYLLSTDIDMIYAENFVEVMLEKASPDARVNAFNYFLPEDFNDWRNIQKYKDDFQKGDKTQVGGALMIPKAVYDEIGGYDEYYRLWGLEDIDFTRRLDWYGLKHITVGDETSYYHQWHRQGYWKNIINYGLPNQHSANKRLYYLKNINKVIRNIRGKKGIINSEARSAFEYLAPDHELLENDIDIIDASPYKEISGLYLIQSLENSDVVGVINLNMPIENKISSRVLKYAIKLEKLLTGSISIGYNKNILNGAVDNIIMNHEDLYQDYYYSIDKSFCLFVL